MTKYLSNWSKIEKVPMDIQIKIRDKRPENSIKLVSTSSPKKGQNQVSERVSVQ